MAEAALDIGLGLVPGGGVLSPVKTALSAVRTLVRLGREQIEDDRRISLSEQERREQKQLFELVLDGLAALFDAALPACILIDDAQFSTADPSMTLFTAALIDRAWRKGWPLLLLITHWEREWNEGFEAPRPAGNGGDGSAEGNGRDADCIARVLHARQGLMGESLTVRRLGPVEDLGPMLADALSGLTGDQAAALLAHAGGNPRYLDEIIRLCRRRQRHFEDRDTTRALTEAGLKEVLAKSLALHDLIEDRLADAPEPVRRAVTLSSLQGERFLTALTVEVAEALGLGDAPAVNGGLSQAEDPHAFLRGVADGDAIAEFAQRVYREVAAESLADITDAHAAREALKAALRRRLSEDATFIRLEERANHLSLRIAISSFMKTTEVSDRHLAAQALAALAGYELVDLHNEENAEGFVALFAEGAKSNLWSWCDFEIPIGNDA